MFGPGYKSNGFSGEIVVFTMFVIFRITRRNCFQFCEMKTLTLTIMHHIYIYIDTALVLFEKSKDHSSYNHTGS